MISHDLIFRKKSIKQVSNMFQFSTEIFMVYALLLK